MGMSLVRGLSWPPTRCYRDEAVSLLPAAAGSPAAASTRCGGRRVYTMRRPPHSGDRTGRGRVGGRCCRAPGPSVWPRQGCADGARPPCPQALLVVRYGLPNLGYPGQRAGRVLPGQPDLRADRRPSGKGPLRARKPDRHPWSFRRSHDLPGIAPGPRAGRDAPDQGVPQRPGHRHPDLPAVGRPHRRMGAGRRGREQSSLRHGGHLRRRDARLPGRRADRPGVLRPVDEAPGGAATAQPALIPAGPDAARARAAGLSLLIAAGIGMHNFGEGLAIGASAAAGKLSLALLLVIGFGAHNATEGFGIVAPLAAAGERPTWGRLILLGVIGGGPTFVGTLVGQAVSTPLLGIAFLALAAGSILYVVIELLAVARASKLKELVSWAILLGIVLGFVTDAIVTAAGA